jgi:maleate cis-trans isomerase
MTVSPQDTMLARIAAVRARVGIIISANNQMVESQLHHATPAGLEFHATRMHLSMGTKRPILAVQEEVLAAARLVDYKTRTYDRRRGRAAKTSA